MLGLALLNAALWDGYFLSSLAPWMKSGTAGMLLAVRDAGLAGKVKFVGFDSGETLNAGLMAGHIDGLVVQNPMQMG